jgi:hypothetical protein
MGMSKTRRAPEIFTESQLYGLFIDYNLYRAETRFELNLKGGLSWQQDESVLTTGFKIRGYKPYVGIGLNIYLFKLKEAEEFNPYYRYNKNLDGTLNQGLISKNFNPAIGIGYGAGYGFHMGRTLQFNIGPFFMKIGRSFNFSSNLNSIYRSLQYGLNLLDIRIRDHYILSPTISVESSRPFVQCLDGWCADTYIRRAVLLGFNAYKLGSRISMSSKLGLGSRVGFGSEQDFEAEYSYYPYVELGFQLHLFRFSLMPYVEPLLQMRRQIIDEARKEHSGSTLKHSMVVPFVSTDIGRQVGSEDQESAIFGGYSLGLKIWKCYTIIQWYWDEIDDMKIHLELDYAIIDDLYGFSFTAGLGYRNLLWIPERQLSNFETRVWSTNLGLIIPIADHLEMSINGGALFHPISMITAEGLSTPAKQHYLSTSLRYYLFSL